MRYQRTPLLPLAILMDRGTASAAEHFATALRTAAGALLVGDHTAGAEAEKALTAVSAVIDLRTSRRFMKLSRGCAALGSASRVPSSAAPLPQV